MSELTPEPVFPRRSPAGATGMAVAVVNYNTREHLHGCIASAYADGATEVVVVDHGSTDGSATMVREVYPEVRLEVDPSNPGYGAGVNRAVAACRSPYVLVVNSDVRLVPGALARLTHHLDENPAVGIVGPRLLNPDGSLQHSCYPFLTPFRWVIAIGNLGRIWSRIPLVRRRSLFSWPHDSERKVPWVKGAALAIRREAFQRIGGFDESFFMYFEEVDLCYRMWRSGWEVHFHPAADVIHFEAASTSQQRARMALQFFASTLHFYERHYSPSDLRRLERLATALMWKRIARDEVRLRFAKTRERRHILSENLTVWRRFLAELNTPRGDRFRSEVDL